MKTHRSNASVVAVLVILLVIAGVIYLFWQNQKLEAPVVEETAPAESTTEVEVEASAQPAESN